MVQIIITLAAVSFVLFILSLFVNDKFKEVEQQIEHLSMSNLQESYKLTRKIEVLEEEILPNEDVLQGFSLRQPDSTKEIEQLYKQGLSLTEISKKTQLSEYDIETVIKNLSHTG
ncbi:hypothetical protein SAMN04488134_101333 [Amphibacillus marinus]|uniref:Helix-turn-helix domain of resolvase n=1 Tax=Amphibacillus marinus TaxID=872970 RepID=A0A1H8HFH2_9BACI|nr:hypothetical protein [Amphibacillus marinus]SEN55026.1 hypothetical protein SAMN04488134_101333 [Amphibacillus marinus]